MVFLLCLFYGWDADTPDIFLCNMWIARRWSGGTVCFLHTGKADRTVMALSAFSCCIYIVFMLYVCSIQPKHALGQTKKTGRHVRSDTEYGKDFLIWMIIQDGNRNFWPLQQARLSPLSEALLSSSRWFGGWPAKPALPWWWRYPAWWHFCPKSS